MTTNAFADLKSFFSGYFHEDWETDASGPDEVISQYLKSAPDPNEINRVVTQIGCYLNGKDEAAIERGLFEEFGCYYLPTADGISARNWLRHVADLLRRG